MLRKKLEQNWTVHRGVRSTFWTEKFEFDPMTAVFDIVEELNNLIYILNISNQYFPSHSAHSLSSPLSLGNN